MRAACHGAVLVPWPDRLADGQRDESRHSAPSSTWPAMASRIGLSPSSDNPAVSIRNTPLARFGCSGALVCSADRQRRTHSRPWPAWAEMTVAWHPSAIRRFRRGLPGCLSIGSGQGHFEGSINLHTVIRLAGLVASLSGDLPVTPSIRWMSDDRSEEHTSELQSLRHLVC